MEIYHFFWKGYLSNWARVNFVHNGVKYNCGEQMMMHLKALLFNDKIVAEKILLTSNPKEIKALGREVKNFDQNTWNDNKYSLVKNGLKSRFEQDYKSKSELLKNKGKIFVEASPFDRIWGIGFDEETALENKDDWGENLLGKILTELSNEIK